MELMWSFLNVVQVINYIPNLKLFFPSTMKLMFSFLAIANQDISILSDLFAYLFNINSNTFANDRALHGNFEENNYPSMKIIKNLQSQLAMIVIFFYIFCLVVLLKNLMFRCFGKNTFLRGLEQSFIWNGLMRFYMESFLEINTSAYINVLDVIHS